MKSAPRAKWWQNPTVIAAMIAAMVALFVAMIGLIPKTTPPETTRLEQPPSGSNPNVEAVGGVAAGRDLQGNTITITGPERETPSREQPKGP